MILYVSKCNDKLNSKELNTESISEYLCLNPIYPVTINNKDAKILMDSGAYQDTEKTKRLTFEKALARQLKYEQNIGVMIHRIVAYDFIGDLEETLKSNEFLVSKRKELEPRQLVLMIQGNSTYDYINCLIKTLNIADKNDCIGFGGVATAGKVNEVKFKLLDAFKLGLPLIFEAGIKDIHIFGVGSFTVLKEIKKIMDIYKLLNKDIDQINISCDTSSFEVRSVMGSVINIETEKWEKTFSKADKYINYHPADLTTENTIKAIKIIGSV